MSEQYEPCRSLYLICGVEREYEGWSRILILQEQAYTSSYLQSGSLR